MTSLKSFQTMKICVIKYISKLKSYKQWNSKNGKWFQNLNQIFWLGIVAVITVVINVLVAMTIVVIVNVITVASFQLWCGHIVILFWRHCYCHDLHHNFMRLVFRGLTVCTRTKGCMSKGSLLLMDDSPCHGFIFYC